MITTNKGRFNFITEQVLRDNLNQVFSDILSFVSIMDTYSEELQINFRRAIIIYTAAVIEALIHYLIEKKVKPLEFDEDEWKMLGNPHIMHEYHDKDNKKIQIICAKRYKKKRKITKSTHFKQLNNFALSKSIISESLFNEIEKVRKMRNRIHLAPLEDVENKYTKHALNTVFETAHKVVQLVEAKT